MIIDLLKNDKNDLCQLISLKFNVIVLDIYSFLFLYSENSL